MGGCSGEEVDAFFGLVAEGDASDGGFGEFLYAYLGVGCAVPVRGDEAAFVFEHVFELVEGVDSCDVCVAVGEGFFVDIVLDVVEERK